MTFKNLPTDKKEEVTSPSDSFSATPETKNDTMRTVVVFSIKALIVIAVIAFFGWKAFNGVQRIIQAKDEVFFAIQHPQLVKPVRELYTLSHQKADEDLKQILSGGKE